MLLALAALFLAANTYAFSQQWRQRERLVADGLRQPRGVVWMPDDALVVAEAGDAGRVGSGRLTHASASSGRQTILDGLPSDASGGPTGIARAANGKLLIVTGPCAGHRCAALLGPDAAGELVVLADLRARPGAGPRSRPWGLALGPPPDGAAYVTDAGTGELLRVEAPALGAAVGTTVATVADFGPAAAPHGLAVGGDGALHVALSGAGAVVRVGLDGSRTTLVDGLAEPIAVGFDPEGRLLVLEHASGQLLRLRPAGGTPEVVARGLDGPTGLALAPDGRVYVTVRGRSPDGHPGQLLQIRRLGPVGPRRVI
jgi:glucose/arabinose dehydrogenase